MDVPHFACPHPSMDTCVAPTFPLLWLALLYIYKKNVFQALARGTRNPFPFLFFCWLDKADTVVHHVDKSNSPEMEGPGPPTTSWSRGVIDSVIYVREGQAKRWQELCSQKEALDPSSLSSTHRRGRHVLASAEMITSPCLWKPLCP